jgi:VWFA-related protein
MLRILLLTFLSALLVAGQDQPSPQKQQPQEPQGTVPRIVTTVEEVVVPVIVFDRSGGYVNGLRPEQFRLFDNTKEQNIHVSESYQPISMVIAIQANSNANGLLPQVNRIGSLISPLLIGDQGEAAVIAYDSRIQKLQDFTSDPEKITEAVKKIYAGSRANRMIDAVSEGTRMLRSRPRDRRRIFLLIGETRDLSSETRAREALMDLQLANVAFYSVDMSRFMNTLTAAPPVPRPDNNPPAMRPLPAGVPSTPTTIQQTYGTNGSRAEFIPMMVELFKDVKAIFKDNPVELFTKGTGGSEFGFHSRRTLEDAIQKIGEELHSEYTITYTPNNREEGGFHEIAVEVPSRRDAKTQARPGYWVAMK